MKFKKAVLVEIEDYALDKKCWDELDGLIETRVSISRKDPNFLKTIEDADCLLVGFQIDVGKDVIDAAPNLKYIGVLATAYGTVDYEYAASKNISVCNLAGYSTEAVAEFTITMILWQLRQIEEGVSRARKGNYGFEGMSARELKNSEFGVIGLGSIGNRVAELAAGFGAKVSYWSRNKKETPFKYKELNDLLSSSDDISVNIAETPETTNLLNKDNLALLKSGAILVNTVPPPVINTDDLAARLSKGDITYIFDHADEMTKEDLAKLNTHKNCLALGPIGFITKEARKNKQEIFVGNIKAFLEGAPQNVVK
ncbi:MAG: 2-hydroxyacid dehydrogenase [Patescibacteria group bacterium]